ncbi:unnamed protein product [Calypogeia fissa]
MTPNNVNLKGSASAGSHSSSGHGLQTSIGWRQSCGVDALTSRSGRDLHSIACNSAAGRASFGETTVVADFGGNAIEGYKLDVFAYNVLLGRFCAGRVWTKAKESPLQMIEDGMQLDDYSYSTLISCALQCSSTTEALKWFDKMHEDGCVPDEVTYNNMALMYSKLRRYDDAVQLYECLRETEAGFKPEAVVYNTLIRYLSHERKNGQVRHVFQNMEKARVKPT